MSNADARDSYFPYGIQISLDCWNDLGLGPLAAEMRSHGIPRIQFFRELAWRLNRSRPQGAATVHAAELNMYASLQRALHHLVDGMAKSSPSPSLLLSTLRAGGLSPESEPLKSAQSSFVSMFPPAPVLAGSMAPDEWLDDGTEQLPSRELLLREMLLLRLASANRAIDSFREILDDSPLAASSAYIQITSLIDISLKDTPRFSTAGCSLIEALHAVIAASPDSLSGQLAYLKANWQALLPAELLEELDIAFDILNEEQRERGGGSGPAPVLRFGAAAPSSGDALSPAETQFQGIDYPAYEQFSPDHDWMANVVLMAKMVYVWLHQLSQTEGYPITRLDQIPDAELDQLAKRGFTGLWLIGIWERSPASQRIKQLCGNPEAIASAYSLYDYEVAADLGGWEALGNLRYRALKRGIRLASDMVPNHTGIFSRWVLQHPDWFVQSAYPPFPTYQFSGEDLSGDSSISIQIEDGYWSKSDAAVVFRHHDNATGQTRYIYHGNDGTSIPWNDTAQLNYLLPELREAVIQTILHVARNFPIIRFDAAMTLAKKHYQRLWFPLRGLGGGVPSRAGHGMSREEFNAVFPEEFWREVVDRVAQEVPGTLLLAEAFWMMEGYFVRTLGMHRVYNSAFMNMIKNEENAKYRKTIKNVLEFNHEILKRFVNFMNNPDEKTAVAQFGSEGKYFGACLLLATMPGLPMFGHGQIEGFKEKYGMEYKQSYWNEPIDEGLVRGHEMWIFPLLRRRALFSGSENFVLYDFHAGESIDENVFAYSNRVGEESALVLYHNRHATTSGWIRESALFAADNGGESKDLVRTTLAEALGAGLETGDYLAFRDQTQRVEYLRSAAEMHAEGLYLELKEYQFHIFMEFRKITDDADRSWQKLHEELQGVGVPSLEVRRKGLRFAALNSAMEELLAADGKAIPAAFADFYIAVAAEEMRGGASSRKPALKKRSLKSLSQQRVNIAAGQLAAFVAVRSHKPKLKTIDRGLSGFERFRDPSAKTLLLSWLALRDSSLDPLDTGLDNTLCKQGNVGFTAHSVELLQALLEWWRSGGARDARPLAFHAAELFELPSCSRFIQLHESSSVEWFNRECFEELLAWVAMILLLDRLPAEVSPRMLSIRAGKALRELAHLTGVAEAAGYRRRLFESLKEPSGITPIPDKR